jgi:hypothetical protein
MKAISVLFLALLVAGWFTTPSASASSVETVMAAGRVIKVNAIGGETTGFALSMRQALVVNGQTLNQIELSAGIDLRKYLFQRVTVAGYVEIRQGIERGPYPVLVVQNIKRIPAAQP